MDEPKQSIKGTIAASMLPLGIVVLGTSLCLVRMIQSQNEINRLLDNLSKDPNLLKSLKYERDGFMYCSIGFGVIAALIAVIIVVYVVRKKDLHPFNCLIGHLASSKNKNVQI